MMRRQPRSPIRCTVCGEKYNLVPGANLVAPGHYEIVAANRHLLLHHPKARLIADQGAHATCWRCCDHLHFPKRVHVGGVRQNPANFYLLCKDCRHYHARWINGLDRAAQDRWLWHDPDAARLAKLEQMAAALHEEIDTLRREIKRKNAAVKRGCALGSHSFHS